MVAQIIQTGLGETVHCLFKVTEQWADPLKPPSTATEAATATEAQ